MTAILWRGELGAKSADEQAKIHVELLTIWTLLKIDHLNGITRAPPPRLSLLTEPEGLHPRRDCRFKWEHSQRLTISAYLSRWRRKLIH